MCPSSGCEQQRTVSLVPAWFRADSGTNLIKHGRNCNMLTMWLGSSMVRVLGLFVGLFVTGICHSILAIRLKINRIMMKLAFLY